MGLDTSHNCWHGPYSAFMRWRQGIAVAAGLPPLDLMDGFWSNDTFLSPLKGADSFQAKQLRQQLPIRWEALKPDVLHVLLSHSDCDGELATEICGPLADRLEELLPTVDDTDRTAQFIKGLRLAAKRGEKVAFR